MFQLTCHKLLILAVLLFPMLGKSAEQPNIVLILADDLGYGDVGFTGGTSAQTPNIDRLAGEGMVLTDFHSNGAACTPTRAALLTGRYQQRSGLSNVLFVGKEQQLGYGLAPEEILIPEVLNEAGYRSALFGKWHVGGVAGSHPLNQGFETFIGNIEGHVDYISKWNRKFYDWNNGFEPFEEEGYVTHLLTQHTLDFIEENCKTPFFIFLSHACSHTPHMLPGDEPMYGTDNPVKTMQPEKYYPMIEELDRSIGEILTKLDETGLAENTVVIFTSDNGPHHGAGSSGPYRGAKGDVYEGGHHVPFAIRWPAKIGEGSQSRVPGMTMDLMPTLLDLVGLPQPRALDGISLKPVLLEGRDLPERPLYWDKGGGLAIRMGDYKLVKVRDRKSKKWTTELFNLSADPSEQNDLAEQMPEKVTAMSERLGDWTRSVRKGAVVQPAYRPQKSESNKSNGRLNSSARR